jgi:hypothetical protein
MEKIQHTDENQKSTSGRSKKFLLLLVLLMTLVASVFAWLYWIQKNKTQEVITENMQVTAEAEIVKRDLQQLQKEYESLKTTDSLMKNEIHEKSILIAQMQIEAEKHKNDAYIIAKLKKETQTLRDIMKHFVKEIDSLNTLNKSLIASKDSVTTELKSEKQKSMALQTEKEKLYKMGSVIKANEIKVKAIHLRGKNKEEEVTKAKKTDKILISFKLGENKIAPKGTRTIYIRMITPDGKEWTESADADHTFTFGNSKGFYAAKKTIQYDNEETEVVMYVNKKEDEVMLPGKYIIEINMDNSVIGSANMELE